MSSYPMKRRGVIHEHRPRLKTTKIRFSDSAPERVISPDAKEYNKQNSQTREEREQAKIDIRNVPTQRILGFDPIITTNTSKNRGTTKRKELIEDYNRRMKRAKVVRTLEKSIKQELEELEKSEQQKAKIEQEENNNSGGSNKSKKNKSKSKSTKKNKSKKSKKL